MASIGETIRNLRREKGMTQQELSQNIVTPSMISQIESNRATPSAKVLEQLAERLGVPFSVFHVERTTTTDLTQRLRKARSLVDKERYEEAVPILKELSAFQENNAKLESIFQLLAECYVQLEQLEDASMAYEEVIRFAVEKNDIATAVHAYFHLGNLERRRKRQKLSLMYWTRASEMLAQHPSLHMPLEMKIYGNLARLYLDRGDIQQSHEAYLRMTQLAEEYGTTNDMARAYHGLAYTYTELMDFENALIFNEKAIQTYEKSGQLRGMRQCQINQAYILRCAKQYRQAIDYCSQLIDLREFPRDNIRLAGAYIERAESYFALGELENAVEDTQMALQQDGQNITLQIQANFILARVAASKQDYKTALEYLDVSLEKVDSNDLPQFTELKHHQAIWTQKWSGDQSSMMTIATQLANSILREKLLV
ncbi:helix-turn-helix domain-containing protein [Alicyclobacillus tolerans]|uniref:helix-turn-helix domain-containing protein n=1 Tax=Alicyclobacillus tolerans TaxID=90970 RepID=UPI003B7C8E4A